MKEKVVKKKQKVMTSYVQTPMVKNNVKDAKLKGALECLRKLPADGRMAVLKTISLDPLQLQSDKNAINPIILIGLR